MPEEEGSGPLSDEDDSKIKAYFCPSSDDVEWDIRSRNSLDEIVSDLYTWKASKNRQNIFLFDSYSEARRSSAAYYVASRLNGMGMDPVLIRKPEDIKRKPLNSVTEEIAEVPIYFLNYDPSGEIDSKTIRKIILRLAKRTVSDTPVVVSLPNDFIKLFKEEKREEYGSYPQNSLSRAILIAGLAILLTPLLQLPYTQIPLGNGSGLSDSGLVVTLLFLYSLALMLYGRKKLKRRHSYPMLGAILIFLASYPLSSLLVPGISASINAIFPAVELAYLFSLSSPTILRLVSFSLFPYGFSMETERGNMIVRFLVSSAIVLSSLYIFNYTSLSDFLNIQLATFNNGYFFIDVFTTSFGNSFLTSIASIPVAVLYFHSYWVISSEIKVRYRASSGGGGKHGQYEPS